MKAEQFILPLMLASLCVCIAYAEQPANTQQSENKSLVEKSKETLDQGVKKVTGFFGKVKSKVTGQDNTHPEPDKIIDNKQEKLKKVKIHESYLENAVILCSKNLHAKCDSKYGITIHLDLDISVYFELTGKEAGKNYYRLERHLYNLKQTSIPAGQEILIRTGNDKVYKAVTDRAYSNESYIDQDINTKVVSTEYTPLTLVYLLPQKCMQDMVEYGVKKVRIGKTDGYKFSDTFNDYVFTDKQFNELHRKIKNIYHSISLKQEEIRKKPIITRKPEVIPEF